MPFAAATAQKIGKYLGYPASNDTYLLIDSALDAIDAMTNTTYSAAAIATIEGYLTALDTLNTAILAQAQLEGSTLLAELRREVRRHCSLVALATGIQVNADIVGSSGV